MNDRRRSFVFPSAIVALQPLGLLKRGTGVSLSADNFPLGKIIFHVCVSSIIFLQRKASLLSRTTRCTRFCRRCSTLWGIRTVFVVLQRSVVYRRDCLGRVGSSIRLLYLSAFRGRI